MASIFKRKLKTKTTYRVIVRRKGFKTITKSFNTKPDAIKWGREMGDEEDNYAVCDTNLRVKGVKGLRIFDASSFPNLVAGNTNAPVIAFALKAVTELINEYQSNWIKFIKILPPNNKKLF